MAQSEQTSLVDSLNSEVSEESAEEDQAEEISLRLEPIELGRAQFVDRVSSDSHVWLRAHHARIVVNEHVKDSTVILHEWLYRALCLDSLNMSCCCVLIWAEVHARELPKGVESAWCKLTSQEDQKVAVEVLELRFE